MTSVLVIGSGLGGLFAAVRAADAGHSVTLVTKGALAESNTGHAQGGIAASLFPDDSPSAHLLDTLLAGAGLSDAAAAQVLCDEGPARVRDLIRFGAHFDQDESGLARGLEAAHLRARVLHAGGDATGAEIARAMLDALSRRPITVREHTLLVELLTEAGRVVGAEVQTADGRREALHADAVVLATGGAGQLFLHTTNPAIATGDGVAAAWRAGAALRDLEFVQFHPTALDVPGTPLVSEAVRGEGAVLLNAAGERFMLGRHPLAELAPRDIVAREIATEMAAQGGRPVLLDATALAPTPAANAALLARRFPTISAACDRNGLDWAASPVAVTPAAHYWMGGVETDLWGRSSLPGLFAVGEAACTGVHGANRLASNSLLEAAVFAERAVQALTADATERPADLPVSGCETRHAAPGASEHGASHAASADRPRDAGQAGAAETDAGLRARIQTLLWDAAGLQRDGATLAAAAATLAALPRPHTGAGASRRAVEDANLLDLSRLLVAAASARTASVGAHFRRDAAPAENHDESADSSATREDALAC
ncbi:L-aspartate oxidase [Microterricola viridarii]|uniref:L-aspartate oxidase n=1 Tax=Microterricola viridarii TaxID=412690 RepID=A0A1H1XDP8_9MICO|nr:L-aspartate oxidase [Microterricola viridarii]SDT07415.1 L-aspartate oxidase [Microterricola viridarii]